LLQPPAKQLTRLKSKRQSTALIEVFKQSLVRGKGKEVRRRLNLGHEEKESTEPIPVDGSV